MAQGIDWSVPGFPVRPDLFSVELYASDHGMRVDTLARSLWCGYGIGFVLDRHALRNLAPSWPRTVATALWEEMGKTLLYLHDGGCPPDRARQIMIDHQQYTQRAYDYALRDARAAARTIVDMGANHHREIARIDYECLTGIAMPPIADGPIEAMIRDINELAGPDGEMTATRVLARQRDALAAIHFGNSMLMVRPPPAEARAHDTLLAHLNDEQREEFLRTDTFHVQAANGRRYKLHYSATFNVEDVQSGKRYCAVLEGGLPMCDTLLAQKLLLETDPRALLSVANVQASQLEEQVAARRWFKDWRWPL